MKTSFVLCLGLAALSLPATLVAQSSSNPLVTAGGSTISSGNYTINTSNDLLDGVTATSFDYATTDTNTYNGGFTGGGNTNTLANNIAAVANLTDGSFGGAVPSQGNFASGGGPGSGYGYDITYSLGTNALGYNLTDVEVYSGWQDAGRYQQAYTIEYSLVTAPSTFLTLTTVSPYPTNTSGATGAETMLTPTAGTTLLTGVSDVEIVFGTVANGWSGYREFVVNGSPVTAPEPSTFALLALGTAGLVVVLRRRGQANC